MVEAVHYMEVDWRDNVVKPFNEQLAGNYPFNPRASQDASLDAFERFFKPDGILTISIRTTCDCSLKTI